MFHLLFQMYTDSYFLWAADEAVRLHLSRNKLEGGGPSVYYYYFEYRGPHSFSELFGDPTRDFGVLQKRRVSFTGHISVHNSQHYINHAPEFYVMKL